jgi:hypothetical protein
MLTQYRVSFQKYIYYAVAYPFAEERQQEVKESLEPEVLVCRS